MLISIIRLNLKPVLNRHQILLCYVYFEQVLALDKRCYTLARSRYITPGWINIHLRFKYVFLFYVISTAIDLLKRKKR